MTKKKTKFEDDRDLDDDSCKKLSFLVATGYTCQECGARYAWAFNYCPDCGHKHHTIHVYRPGVYNRIYTRYLRRALLAECV